MLCLFLAGILLVTPVKAQRFGELNRSYLELTDSQQRELREKADASPEWRRRLRKKRRGRRPIPWPLGSASPNSSRSADKVSSVSRRSSASAGSRFLEQDVRLSDTAQDANREMLTLPYPLDRACGRAHVDLRPPLPSPAPITPGIVDPSIPFDPTAPLCRYLELMPAQSAVYLRNLELLRSREAAAGRRLACSKQDPNRALTASPLSPADIGFAKANAIKAYRLIRSLTVFVAFSGIPGGVGPYFCPSQ